jgi:hypothetical protein
LLAASALAALALLVWLREGLWNRFVRFPREERAWAELRARREPVPEDAGWPEFRGALHAHSELSHDSEVTFPDILRAMARARLDFIVLGDHAQPDGRADFSAQWRGLHDGKLLIAGFELRDGFLAFGARPGVTLSNRTPPDLLARQLVAAGGVLFYAHPENPRDWDRPELSGMEIHNLHSDFKRAYGSVAEAVRARFPDLLLSHGRFPEHVARLAFARPEEFLRRWDEVNRSRPIAGVAGNDAHQNVGVRAVVTERGRLRLEDPSPRRLAEFGVPDWLRPAVAAVAGPLEPGRRLFTVQFDPYDLSLRYVNTHVLARRLDESEIVAALRIGRAFVAYDLMSLRGDDLAAAPALMPALMEAVYANEPFLLPFEAAMEHLLLLICACAAYQYHFFYHYPMKQCANVLAHDPMSLPSQSRCLLGAAPCITLYINHHEDIALGT